MNMIGNKGAVMLQFELYSKVFCFVNMHLESGARNAPERAEMMSQILRGIMPSKAHEKFEPDATADFTFLLGDFNSRFKSTYTLHIDKVAQSCEMLDSMDELYEVRS